MTPTAVRTDAFGWALAAALRCAPGVRLHAVCQMSNHFHLVLTDTASELAGFMGQLNGRLARALNRIDGESGPVFGRRYTASEIVDDEALAERIAYTVTNPVAAGLVERREEWPAAATWFAEGVVMGARLRWREWRSACRSAWREVPREEFLERVEVPLTPVGDENRVREAIVARTRALAGRSVIGRARVLAVRPLDRPLADPARRPAPLCHAGSVEARRAFAVGWDCFVEEYRRASERFRGGVLETVFPPFAFRPRLPLTE